MVAEETFINERTRAAISVVAVDDHRSYVRGLKSLLESLSRDIQVVAVGFSLEDALELVEEHLPDIVLMDVRMPNREGIEATHKICELWPSVKVAMLTMSDDPEDVVAAMTAGADGYLMKTIEAEELVAALHAIGRGQVVLNAVAADILFKADRPRPTPLTDADIRVLRLLAEGADQADIAVEVSVSESTLKRQIRAIEKKLGARNRMQAISLAAKRNLI